MNTLRIGCLVVIILCMSELSQGKNDTYSLQLISLKCNIDFEDIHLKAVYMPLGSVSNVAMEYTNGTSFNDSNTWFPFTECSNATKNTLDCKAMDVYDNNTYYIRLTYNNGTHMKLIGPYTPSTYRRQCVTGQPKVVLVKLLSISSTSLTVFAKVSQDAYFTFPVEAIMTLTDPHFSKQKFPCLLKSKEATCVATGLEPANEYKTCVTMFMKFFQKYTSCLTSVTEKAPTTGPTEMTVTTTQTITGRSSTSGVMSTTVLEKNTTAPSEPTNMKTDETIDTKTTTTTTATKLATTLPTEITPTDEKITATTTKTTTANNTITAEKATNVTTATTTTMASTTPLPTEITLTLVNSSCEVKSFYVYLTANFLTDHLDIAKVSMQYRKDLSTWFPIKTSPKEFDTCVRQKFKKVSSITCQVSSIFDPMTYEIDLIYKDLSVRVVDAFVPSQQLCESGSPPVSLLVSAAGLSAITIDSYVPSSKKFGTKTSIVGYDSNNKTVDATKFCKSYGIANISCTWSGLSPCKTYQFCYQSKSKTNGNYTKCSNAKTKGCYVKMNNGEHNTINGIALSLYTICGLAIATLVAVSAVWIVRHRNNHRSTGIVRMHGSYENLDSNHSNHQLQVEYHADDERLTLIN